MTHPILFRPLSGCLLVTALALSAVSCSNDDDTAALNSIKVASSISFNLTDAQKQLIYTDETGANCLPMVKGETGTLNYSMTPDSITSTAVNWTSTYTNVATVSDQGEVKAISGDGSGYSMVQVAPTGFYSGSGIFAALKIVVSNELTPATAMTVTAPADELYAGDKTQLSLTVLPTNATYKTAKWSSSDESAATVDMYGNVTALVSPRITAPVTITATALDGSGVTATKLLTVKQIVQPQEISIDQSLSADQGYCCAINEQSISLNYTTVPSECTTTLIQWTSSDDNVATVDNGVVTFKGFGDVTITATCPETGKSSTIKLNIPAGLVRETYHHANHYSFYNSAQSGNGTSSSHEWHDGYLSITTYTVNATTQRADIKGYDLPVTLHAGNYPIFAIRMDDVKDKGATSRNINMDVVGTSESGTTYKALGGGNNKYTYDYKCSDGSHVFIYDLTQVPCGTGGLLPTNESVGFSTFQVKYADMKGLSAQVKYNLYWVQTFKSMDDLKAYLTSEGLTYE